MHLERAHPAFLTTLVVLVIERINPTLIHYRLQSLNWAPGEPNNSGGSKLKFSYIIIRSLLYVNRQKMQYMHNKPYPCDLRDKIK